MFCLHACTTSHKIQHAHPTTYILQTSHTPRNTAQHRAHHTSHPYMRDEGDSRLLSIAADSSPAAALAPVVRERQNSRRQTASGGRRRRPINKEGGSHGADSVIARKAALTTQRASTALTRWELNAKGRAWYWCVRCFLVVDGDRRQACFQRCGTLCDNMVVRAWQQATCMPRSVVIITTNYMSYI